MQTDFSGAGLGGVSAQEDGGMMMDEPEYVVEFARPTCQCAKPNYAS